ncbi:tetratricopeptide repeat protein [Kitasatospora sp. NBC_00070]|uniref:hypothetical protein n=1 Tax=Kitasatospora sp. NBC_00070 TaxID=2975962 RepID=UPI003247803A
MLGADLHVSAEGVPLYRLAGWRPPAPLDHVWLGEQPSRLLDARSAVVGFTGRERELAELRDWCAVGPPAAARWLHAPGGQGKSRIADRLAGELAESGWQVVTADEGPDGLPAPPGGTDLRVAGAVGLLLLVDRADHWTPVRLTLLLGNALLRQRGLPTRVLLLARSADAPTVLRAAFPDTTRRTLPPLPTADRPALFRAAVDAFAERYGVRPPADPVALDHPDFGLTLAVLMAALVTVDAYATGRRAPTQPAGLSVHLLDREQLNWARLHREHRPGGFSSPPWVMNRTVFAATLVGPQSPDTGAELIESLGLEQPTAALLADHTTCYPPPVPGTVLPALAPDRLAEDFLALTLPGHPADHPAQPWAPAIAAVLTRGGWRPGRAVTVLAATAARWPHVGPNCLFPLLTADPAVAVAAGSPGLTALAALPGIEPPLLERILAAIPSPAPADLVPGRAALTVRLLPHRLGRTDDPAAHARLHAEHAEQLGALGRDEQAVEAARRTVQLLGHLVAAEPARYEHRLARSLAALADRLAVAGRLDEAVAAQARAVELLGRRADFEPGLAAALAAHSTLLERAGRWGEAHRANRQAVQRYRRLVAQDRSHRAGLAAALSAAAGLSLRGLGAADDLDPAREAVAHWRELTAEDPASHRGDLARALLGLRDDLSRAGRRDEAVRAAEELVALCPEPGPVDEGPDDQERAAALGELRRLLTAAGRPGEAVRAGAAAVALWQRLAQRAPATYRAALLEALDGQRETLRAADRRAGPAPAARGLWSPPPVPVEVRAAELARQQDWPAYWELACTAPVVDAAPLAARLLAADWHPPAAADRELLRRLTALDTHRVAAAAARAVGPATVRLPAGLRLLDADHVSFAHGSPALALATPGHGTRQELIETLELGTDRRTALHLGEAGHSSVVCLGPGQVVAARRVGGDDPHFELVRHSAAGPQLLAAGFAVAAARLVPTGTGYVAGLRLSPGALVDDGSSELRQVGLEPWGLANAELLAVAPGGDLLVLSDGRRLVLADTGLRAVLGTAGVPEEPGRLLDLTFAGPDRLLGSGRQGGLTLWELAGAEPRPTVRRDTPRLRNLFAVPAWQVVGGLAPSEGRVHFYDQLTLAPVPVPPHLAELVEWPRVLRCSPDGRYVAYAGRPVAGSGAPDGSGLLHDLHHPGALLHRPPGALSATESAVLGAPAGGGSEDPDVRELLALARVLALRTADRGR